MRSRPVAVLGLGGMGAGMARALLAAGASVTAWNRSPDKAESLAEAGARVAASAEDAIAGACVTLVSLADETAVEQVVFGELSGRFTPGTVVVDTSTVSPAFAVDAQKRLAEAGVGRVEACVVGNPEMAAAGRLRVYAAGDEQMVDDVREVLESIGQEVRYLGETGRAGALKLAFNLMLGIQILGLAEAVRFVEAMGLDRDLLLQAFEGSGWSSPVLAFRARFMRDRAYRPAAFRSTLMHKDLDMAHREARAHMADLPMVHCALRSFGRVLKSGQGDLDAAVVAELHGDLGNTSNSAPNSGPESAPNSATKGEPEA